MLDLKSGLYGSPLEPATYMLWVLFLKEILHSKIILKSFKIFELWNAWVTKKILKHIDYEWFKDFLF